MLQGTCSIDHANAKNRNIFVYITFRIAYPRKPGERFDTEVRYLTFESVLMHFFIVNLEIQQRGIIRKCCFNRFHILKRIRHSVPSENFKRANGQILALQKS